jgi:hypothetical protein
MNATVDQIRAAAENDLEVFIRLVSPDQVWYALRYCCTRRCGCVRKCLH